MLVTMEMAKLVLDAGFTAGRGAAAAKPRLDVGRASASSTRALPRPALPRGRSGDHHGRRPRRFGAARTSRMRASISASSSPGPRRCAARCASSSNTASIPSSSISPARRSPAWAPRKRRCRRRRSRWRCRRPSCRNKVLSAHARSSGSVKQCVRHGIQNIYHASFADEEALDMLEATKDQHFVAPGIAWLINTARHAEQWGIKPGSPVTMPTSASSKCASRP